MAEEIKYHKENNNNDLAEEKKHMTIAFYVLNLNIYLVSLLFIDIWLIQLVLFILINTFTFRRMFGLERYKRVLFWYVLIILTYILVFDGFRYEYILFALTGLINLGYYLIVIKNGEIYIKLGSKS